MKNRQRISSFTCMALLTALMALLSMPRSVAQLIKIPDSLPHYLKICSESGHSADNFDYIAASLFYKPLVSIHWREVDSMITDHFKGGNEEEFGFLKYFVFQSLSYPFSNPAFYTEPENVLEYGKNLYQFALGRNTPSMKALQWLLLQELRTPFRNSNKNYEGLLFFNEELKRFQRSNDSALLSQCYFSLGSIYRGIGLIDQGIYCLRKSIQYTQTADINKYDIQSSHLDTYLKEVTDPTLHLINRVSDLGEYYFQKKDFNASKQYSRRAISLYKDLYPKKDFSDIMVHAKKNILASHISLSELDSAVAIINETHDDSILISASIEAFIAFQQEIALYHLQIKEYSLADSVLNKAFYYQDKYPFPAYSGSGFIQPDFYRAKLYMEKGQIDQAISSILKNLHRINNVRPLLIENFRLLADLYSRSGRHKAANESYRQFMYQQDSLLADQARYLAINFETEQQIASNELTMANLRNKSQLDSNTRNFSLILTGLLILLAIGIFHRYRYQKRTSIALNNTLNELKATQSQLIQSEKMASLGELTAGIAHEIQNPLNFVNNFSEINIELAAEANDAAEKGDLEEVKALTADIRTNQEKIREHGKRADAIVKGMLQHSQKGSGVKEPTNINALADEYLRLAYHGFRAKDKSFNATIKMDFDQSIGNINIVPQDIGRVLLNLINNAFYAVNEKKKQIGDGYEPEVTVSTKLVNAQDNRSIRQSDNSLIISVRDNGTGIPESVKKKIFQPFFTTKPTGQGTGLGLSLSYDIVKAHGGEIKVESKEGEGSVFTLIL